LDFKINVSKDVPNVFKGDPYRLNQILINLIGNAIKFTTEGSVEINIEAGEKTAKVITLIFSIKDTGIGIEEDKLGEIFGSFTQANNSITRKYGGTGLGLAITKQLLDLQHGHIHVKSNPGGGSIFCFSIPYQFFYSDKQKEISTTDNVSYKNALNGKSFLIVEDNTVNQKVITHVIQKAGGSSDVANNGVEAIELLKNGKVYDIIIMDLQMPEMNGYEATTIIRKDLKLTIPIIAMTASAMKGEKIKCLEIGMSDYLSKPFAFQDFYKSVNSLLNNTNIFVEEAEAPAPLYDLSLLDEMDDVKYVTEILTIFLKETPAELTAMLAATENLDYVAIAQKAHKLKSPVGLLQSEKLLGILAQLEENAKNLKSKENIPALVNEAIEEYKKLEILLQQRLHQMENLAAITYT
jgi:CheY-like chemotaxis protein